MTAPVDPKPEARDATSRRKLIGRSSAMLASLLLLAIVLMLNYLAFRHYERWDWTSEGLFTLSGRTEEVLERLPRNVDVYLFLSEADRNYQEVKEVLDRYRAVSPRVRVHYIDPDREPAEYRVVAQRFGVRAAVLESGETIADVAAVVAAGDRKWTITRDDLLSFDFGSLEGEGGEGPSIDVKAEQAITGAIVQVTSGRATKVCVTTGHGEWSLEGGDERSLYTLKDELKRDNVEMEAFATLGASRVPEGCDSVFVVGPVRAFSEQEAALLERYVRGGGNLLLALDPIIERDQVQPTGLEEVARSLGVRVDDTLVLEMDPGHLLSPSPIEAFLVTSYGEHATMEPLAATGARVVMNLARSVRPVDGTAAVSLMTTSETGFAETDVRALANSDDEPQAGDDDVRGPVPLAVAVTVRREGQPEPAEPLEDDHGHGEPEPTGGRVIVVGDSDWLMAPFLGAPQFANIDLAGAWTGWLTARDAMISIAPRKIDAQAVTMTEDDVAGVFFRVVVLMPAAALLLGFAVWWSRRS